MTDLQALIASQRFFELSALVQRGAFGEPETIRARAELAATGRGPACDLVVAARRALREHWPDVFHYVRLAVRAVGRLGAHELARQLLEAAGSLPDGDAGLAFVRVQLAEKAWQGQSADSQRAFEALARGDEDAAARAFEAAAQQRDPAERIEALTRLAQLARRRAAFSDALRQHQRAHDVAPEGDYAGALALEAALDAWLTGDALGARSRLRQVREQPGIEGSPRATAAARAERILQALERKEGACCWLGAQEAQRRVARNGAPGVLAVVGSWLARDPVQVPDEHERLAHVRRLLRDMGVDCIRVRATQQVLVSALRHGALMVFEEERPIGHALTLLVGFDAQTELVAVREPDQWGVDVALWPEQAASTDMLSGSALLVLGPIEGADALRARLADEGVVHDQLFDELDACEVNSDGEAPPYPEAHAIARRVVERDPACQLAHKRGADALAYGHRAGRVEETELLAWIARARAHFPHAEWPQQRYAEWLATEGRPGEAAIAWASARAADPFDYRNPFGEARALTELGRLDLAEPLLRRALTLRGAAAGAAVWLARNVVARDPFEVGDACAQLATALAPDQAEAWSTLACVLEAQGQADEAIRALDQALTVSNGHQPNLHLRLARSYAAQGQFERALVNARGACPDPSRGPDDLRGDAHVLEARCHTGLGDLAGAQDALVRGLARCRARTELLTALARLLTYTTHDDAEFVAAWSVAVDPHLGDELRGFSEALAVLTDLGRTTEAQAWLERLPAASGREAERAWIVLRTELKAGACDREAAADQLEAVLEAFPDYEPARVLLASLLATHQPARALAHTRVEFSSRLIAAAWFAQANARSQLGQVAEADALRTRLVQLPGSCLASAAEFLRTSGLLDDAAGLLALSLLAQPEDASLRHEHIRQALQRGAVTQAAAALRSLDDSHGSLDRELALSVALAAEDWEYAGTIAREQLRSLRDSRIERDPWPLVAVHAGAALASGNAAPRAELLSKAGRHIEALAVLASIEQKIEDQEGAALARLRQLTPRADALMLRKEVL